MEAVYSRQLIHSKTACRSIGVATVVILTALSAFVRIPVPFSPVPVTLQTFVVLLGGACLAGRKAPLSGAGAQTGYAALGLAGLPVFSGAGSGLLYLTGPTGGYIAGFILANVLLGRLFKNRTDNFVAVAAKFLLADAVVFACGMMWLKILFGYPIQQLLFIGLIPFLAGDIVKICAAALLYLRIQARVRELFA